MNQEKLNKLKNFSYKVLLTIPVIVYGFYSTFIHPILKFLGNRKMFLPVVKLWKN